MNLLIFGPQGSGKGTQSKLLSEKFDLAHIETGKIFRRIAREKTALGKKISVLNEKKEMIPDCITAEVIRKEIIKVPKKMGIILDSAPRTMGQVKPIEKIMSNAGRSIDGAIYLDLPYDHSILRIKRRYLCLSCRKYYILGKEIKSDKEKCPLCGGKISQRKDDTPDGIAKRLRAFHEVTAPVIEHYRKKGILIEVNGNQKIKKVFNDIVGKLK